MSDKYAAFMPGASIAKTAPDPLSLLGWSAFFSQQTDADSLLETPPMRVTSVHRSGLQVQGVDTRGVIPPRKDVTVGDWVLFNAEIPQDSVLLERK
ncbi:MAG: ribosome small subunit-dependent GTPase A, partial [Planktotalea sp.]